MKRGSSVLQPPSDAAKRLACPASTLTEARTGDGSLSLSGADGHAEHAADTAGAQATGPSPFPAATSLFSPDVSTKMASDLLIRLSGIKPLTHRWMLDHQHSPLYSFIGFGHWL